MASGDDPFDQLRVIGRQMPPPLLAVDLSNLANLSVAGVFQKNKGWHVGVSIQSLLKTGRSPGCVLPVWKHTWPGRLFG
jgi:hypothetical protein